MFDLVRVTAVRHVRDHVLSLRFSDGVAGEIDLANDLVGPVFATLRDPREFGRVRLGPETIEWPNGADCAAENAACARAGVKRIGPARKR